MKRKMKVYIWGWALLIGLAMPGFSQSFSSGSTGAFGPINLATGETLTLDMPADGVFHCTTITLAPESTLSFNKNAHNTPVFLLAQGDVLIAGTINLRGSSGTRTPPVGGKGGPGGFDGGTPGILEVPPGDGHGPGGGKAGTAEGSHIQPSAGSGSYATKPVHNTQNDGETYGSPLLVPIVGGSGGGGTTGQPGVGGGGGGGAILISSSTRITITDTGVIVTRGGDQLGDQFHGPNAGSGGAIRLVSPIVDGNGTLDVRGGVENNNNLAGAGRTRIDTITREGILFRFLPDNVVSIGSYLTVFPPVTQKLDIIEVAGQTIQEGFPGVVEILLPFGSATSRTVTVQARGFTGQLPIQVALNPDSGSAIIYDATIDMSQGDPSRAVVNVEIPVNTLTSVYAWTK